MAAIVGAPLLAVAVSGPVAAAPAAAPAPIPALELEIESRLQELLYTTGRVSADANLRWLIRNVAARQVDGDTEALLSSVIAEAEASGLVNTGEWWWIEFKNQVANFVVDGFQYEPQIYIPNQDDGVYTTDRVEMAVRPADQSVQSVQSYWFDTDLSIAPLNIIDEAYVETYEVWVLSVHERIDYGGGGSTVVGSADTAAGPAAQSGPRLMSLACNPTGIRNNRGEEYMHVWKTDDRSTFGTFLGGKREMRLVVISKSGQVANVYFPKVKRKHMTTWQIVDRFLTTWDKNVWGDALGFQWYEVNGGKTRTTEISYTVPNGGPTLKTTVTYQERDSDGGMMHVLHTDSTYKEYNTGKVQFQMCSVGGDGGTGIDNLACGALAAASSTFAREGYAPSRASDCDNNTALGGSHSWANSAGVYPPTNPQWLQLDMGVNKTFRRMVLYTSQGYPIRDFDVQVWNGVTFLTVGGIRGNVNTSVEIRFGSAQTTRLVRVIGIHGPDHQPGFVRVNEVELYAS
ncbi:discoidin domain-containing protein [Phytohabitans aurantiacus]|jgi:hypothetical protein|uniref:F5/8 type C domain-containing protein n=1 Tax=Phytohabitans aurantiacus TaxID=3016789 RepID=A0ABQ5R3T8_9ACTN|nr:discoidin domain-containing protein [Phytohabitans aurantiacus]GLI01454.1 hypothetical protein Pa4123_67300 [Phytohabitans aurantiacus]